MVEKRKKFIWITVIFLLVFVMGAYLTYLVVSSPDELTREQGSDDAAIQQTVARQGSLTVSVSGSGELIPTGSSELSFSERGTLVELNVDVGDMVQAGDILAQLQIDQTPAELAANITNAELEVVFAQQSLDKLYENKQIEAAQALSELEDAQQALDELKDLNLEIAVAQLEVAQAKNAIADAEMQLYILNSSPTQEAVDIAYSNLLFEQKDLEEIEAQVAQIENKIKSAPNNIVRDRLKSQLMNLELSLINQKIEYENALYKYNTMNDPADPIDLSVAEAQLSTAQAQLHDALENLEEIQAGPKTFDIAMAEANVAEAQAEWDRIEAGPDPHEIALAEAELNKAQAKLNLVSQTQLVLELVAPIDGIVASINAAVGDRINNAPVLTLADINQLQVEVYIDEFDSGIVQVGHPVEVVFDALPEKTFNGQIVIIDPGLESTGNTQVLQAIAQLDAISTIEKTLPIGLNAAVGIIVGQVENAVLLPLEALHLQSDSSYFVYVVNDEDIEIRPVEVGLMDLTSIEIISGLQPGERVAIEDLNI